MVLTAVLIAAGITSVQAGGLTCQEVKDKYKAADCCGSPSKEITTLQAPAPACPYDFSKPTCADAGVQSPRDVSDNSPGEKKGAFYPLNDHQRQKLRQVNIHFHLGAEHRSAGEYDKAARRLAGDGPHDHAGTGQANAHTSTDSHSHHALDDVVPGWKCDTTGYNTDEYAFNYCQDVKVGETYEIHWPYSSAGNFDEDNDNFLTDGLGQAAHGRKLLNPIVAVQGQVFFIVNDQAHTIDDMVHGWITDLATDVVRYAGSTTGPSHNNVSPCSPYAVSWFVDRKCHPVHAASWDKMCKDMLDQHGMHHDAWPHGSRMLVDKAWVVPWSEVETGM